MAILLAVLAVVRYGPLTSTGRHLIETAASGLKLGQLGRLKVDGLKGDIWGRFSVAKVTVTDAKGAWIEADRLNVRWSPGALMFLSARIDEADVALVRVVRRPILGPKTAPSKRGRAVTLDLRSLNARVETLPAFSVQRGLMTLAVRLKLPRGRSGETGAVNIRSLLRPTDFVDARFDVRRGRPLAVLARVWEAGGGPFAGALGLPVDRPFAAYASARGRTRAGSLDVTASSGDATVLTAHGVWTRDRRDFNASADLTASSLTADWARRVGPEVEIEAVTRKAKRGLSLVALHAKSANLAVSAQGSADVAKARSKAGLKVTLAATDLSALLGGGPRTASAKFEGLLKGDLAAWRLDGTLDAAGVAVDGYRLARAHGPVSITGRQARFTAKVALQGAGGAGRGMLAAVAGPAPKADADLELRPDGRIDVRALKASGTGFTLTGSGGPSLLGGQSYDARMTLSDLGLVRKGWAGALSMQLSAKQPGKSKPWRIDLRGKARDLKTGAADLDVLLGAAPSVTFAATADDGNTQVQTARIEGAKAQFSATGAAGRGGALTLDTSWSAQGPFRIGPLEIGGKGAGAGTITGTLADPRADLSADFGEVDLPRLKLTDAHAHLTLVSTDKVLTGGIAVNAASLYGPARAKTGFRVAPDGLDLIGVDVDAGGVQLSGSATLRGRLASAADLTVAIGPGAILSQGQASGTLRVADGRVPLVAVDLSASNAVILGSGVVLAKARLTGQGPFSRTPFKLSAAGRAPQGAFSLDGSGVYEDAVGGRRLTLEGQGQFRDLAFHTLEPAVFGLTGTDRITRVRLQLGEGQASLDAHGAGGVFTASGAVRGVDLKAVDSDFAGAFDADFALQGRGDTLAGDLNATLKNARSVDAPAGTEVDGALKASLRGDRLTLAAQATGAGGLKSSLNIVLPAVATAAPLRIAVATDKPIQGQFSAEGEIRPLWSLFYGGERTLAGQARVSATLGGTLKDPELTGQASVAQGRLEDFATGLVLTDLSLDADLKRKVITLASFTAQDGKDGKASGSGSISLERGGASNLTLRLENFRLLDSDAAQARATGLVKVTRGADGRAKLEGALQLNRAEINAETRLPRTPPTLDVVEINRPVSEAMQDRPPPSRTLPVDLDVSLTAPRHVAVKGLGIDAELSLDARVTGTLASPHLTGRAYVVQGAYDFAGHRFAFDDTGSIRLGDSPEQIRLDLSASYETPTLTSTIHIRGTAAKPEITLSSSPSLPQEEILSQVLFGSSAAQLSGAQSAQLASTVTALATGGGFDLMGGLRQLTRLDRLVIGGDALSGVTVAGGKYISDNVYLEIVGGGREGPSAQVVWQVKRRFSIASQLGGQQGAKLTVRWSRDIGKSAPAKAAGKPAP
jgi:translocation and assembly module TamB